jgi:hypothetical protein
MRVLGWILVASLVLGPSLAGAQESKKKVAVLEFTNQANLPAQVAEALADDVREAALVLPRAQYLVMTRESMMMMLPPGTNLAECEGGLCEVEAGHKVGADLVVSGILASPTGEPEVRLKLFDTGTGELIASKTASGRDVKALRAALRESARELFKAVPGAGVSQAPAPGVEPARVGGGTVTAGGTLDKGEAIVNQLTDDTGYLTLESDPPGATLSLNGKEVGKAPKQLEQMAGRWVIVADLGKLYHPARQEVAVTAGSNQKVTLKLEPAFGTLKVDSQPSGAEVWVEGEKVGSTPYANPQKPSGTYEVRVVRESYLSWKQDLTVKDGQETAQMARLEQNFGGLAVTSEPPGAAIELNGRATREVTPHTFGVLEPGVYTVKLTREGYGEAVDRASVQNRQTASLNIAMQAKLGQLSVMATNPDGTPCEGRVYLDGEHKGVTPIKLQVTATTHEVRVVCGPAERKESVAVGHDEKKKLEWVVGAQPAAAVVSGARTGGGGAMRDNGDGTVTDPSTGLVWEKKPSTGDLNWAQAKAHCQAKGRGWHLPTISELRSLIRGCPGTVTGGACRVTDACLSGSCWSKEDCWSCKSGGGPAGGCYWDSTLEGSCGWFWSSSLNADVSNLAWGVNFDFGNVRYGGIGNDRGVRCVRPGP